MKLRAALTAFVTVALLATTVIPAAHAVKSTSEDTNCSATIKKNALAAVQGQSQALAKRDFKTARSYSAASFRAQVTLEDFTSIITQGYGFLAKAKSFSIVECSLINKSVNLGVRIIDKTNLTYFVFYLLDPQGKKDLVAPNKTGYGIVAAQLAEANQSGG